jgi:hypothetical protein
MENLASAPVIPKLLYDTGGYLMEFLAHARLSFAAMPAPQGSWLKPTVARKMSERHFNRRAAAKRRYVVVAFEM